ncbi:hypothetical protein MMC30_004824 [Trapelia coarctata]|nr:hypothetical protein [Trapelia coarctata]
MSKDESQRRFRDLFSSKKRKEKNQLGLRVPATSDTPLGSSAASSTEGIIPSNSRTTTALSLNAVQGPSQPKEGANRKQTLDQEPSGEQLSKKLPHRTKREPVIVEPSLWALAYKDLQEAQPELVEKFSHCLGISTTRTKDGKLVYPDIEGVAHKALGEIQQARDLEEKLRGTSATIRKYFEQTVKVVIASNDFISKAVSANPYAALAWTGVSLLLPLLLNPTQENEAAIKGLDYIANLIVVYRWQEKNYLHASDASSDFMNFAKPLYTRILEYEATLLVHIQQKPLIHWAKDVFGANDWTGRVTSIQLLDANCRSVTNAIAGVRAIEWRNEEREWQNNLLQQPRQDNERQIIRTLYSNYETDKNVNPERITGTCEWFLNHTAFLTWRESQTSAMLWLSADPGCGKSVLSKHLVDRIGEVLTVKIETPTVCYFFFKDGDIDRMDGAKAMCAFLHQILMQQPHLYRYAKEDFDHKSEKFLTDFDALWNIFLKAAANASGLEIICVLDALDECQEDSRKALAAKLVQLYSPHGLSKGGGPIIKFLVTSRPEFRIVRDFKALTSILSEVRLRGEEESEQISREIDLVIRYKVEELGSKMDLNESDKVALKENLSKIPHRTYLWLHLTFDAIGEKLELTKDEIAVISKTIPQDVDQAYTAILDKSPDRERARKLLHIVLAAARPMTLEETNIAMVIEERCTSYESLDHWQPEACENRIKNICGLFLSVVDSKVYLIHQTAREFLVCEENTDTSSALHGSSWGQWKKSFYSAHSNLLLASTCIWYLQLQDFEKKESAPDDKEIGDKCLQRYQENYCFLSYAALHWAAHFTQAGSLPDSALVKTVADRTCDTLSQTFKIWFPIYWKAEEYSLLPSGFTNVLVESYFGHEAVVRLLLERKDVAADSKDNNYGRTPLSYAAGNGHEAVVRLLLERKDVAADSKDNNYGRTPLSYAAGNGHEAMVRLLLERKDVAADSKDNFYGRTPLSYAAGNGHEAMVRLLLERKDVAADSKNNFYGRTPLSYAAGNGHEAVVRLLLERKDVAADSKDDNYGRTPLSYAAGNRHEAVVRLLLERKDVAADSKDDNYGRTPLSYAAENGHKAVVRLLLERKDVAADSKDNNDGRTPLSYAAGNGHKAMVRLLLERKDVAADSKNNYDGRTPLSYAAGNGHEAVVRLLLERKDVAADSKDDNNGQTPLSYAARSGHEAVVRLLLERKDVAADSKDDNNGRTPLSYAARSGHEAVVRLLLERKDVAADSKDDNNGRTPLSYAAGSGHEAVVRLLLERKDVAADSKDDNNGRTPLSYAAENGNKAVVRLLLERKDVAANSKDKYYSSTPLSYAAKNGHEAVVRLLKSKQHNAYHPHPPP